MGRYLKRVLVDPEIQGVEPWYYAKNGKVYRERKVRDQNAEFFHNMTTL